jgi:hypothetical protein
MQVGVACNHHHHAGRGSRVSVLADTGLTGRLVPAQKRVLRNASGCVGMLVCVACWAVPHLAVQLDPLVQRAAVHRAASGAERLLYERRRELHRHHHALPLRQLPRRVAPQRLHLALEHLRAAQHTHTHAPGELHAGWRRSTRMDPEQALGGAKLAG